MEKQMLIERVADIEGFRRVKTAGRNVPFTPIELAHVYIKLEFKSRYENASNADDARGFLRSVARAAMAADRIAEGYEGFVVAVQGSTLHVGLPRTPGSTDELERAHSYVSDLHWAYRAIFNDPGSRVEAWRMTVDAGKTLLVAGRGVHGDDSWVSLGGAANRPAKHLNAQLDLSELERDLKRFHVAVRDPLRGRWMYENLDRSRQRLFEGKSVASEIRSVEPRITFSILERREVEARALPIAPPGTSDSPSAETPQTHFGWVMRADLDGFTQRVDACLNDDQKLQQLAEEFYRIMNAASQFADLHKETLAQLPWAGDNFTAAAVFASKNEYDRAIRKRLVELSLDFEKEMAEAAAAGGFGGWAHGVAGGTVHGNTRGNVYLAGVEVRGRRFLVGAGEGFGRSTQAFAEVNPSAQVLVVYTPDWQQLDESYKAAFEPAVNTRGQQSTLFRAAKTGALIRTRARRASESTTTRVSVATGQVATLSARPYFA